MDGIDLVLEIIGIVVGIIWSGVVTSGITQYAVDRWPQSPSIAFIHADLVTPVSIVLVVVQRPHRLHLFVPLAAAYLH